MKILLIKVSSLGDVIHNMPVVADIIQHFPEAQIDWVVEESYADLVASCQGVRRVIPFALRRWRKTLLRRATQMEMRAFYQQLKADQYNFVLETQGLFKTGLLMHWARMLPGGVKWGLGNATEDSGYEPISRIFHDQSLKVDVKTHAVTRSRLIAAAALGYSIERPPQFHFGQITARPAWLSDVPYVVFFHATARLAKCWSEADWIALGQWLAKQGNTVVLPWGSVAEKMVAERLAAAISSSQVAPRMLLDEAMNLIAHARLIVGVDTGLTHIAAALYCPTIELYCDSPRWKTEGFWSERIINLGDTGQPPALQAVQTAAQNWLSKEQHHE